MEVLLTKGLLGGKAVRGKAGQRAEYATAVRALQSWEENSSA
jgi:hypothetical protein